MVDLEKLEALVHTFPYPTTELAVCVEKAIAELRAARALIAKIERATPVAVDGCCPACYAHVGWELDDDPHKPGCAWVAYDAATRPPSPHSP